MPYSRPGAENNGQNGEPGATNGCQADPINPIPTEIILSCEQKQDDPVCPVTGGPSSHMPHVFKKGCARGYKKYADLHGRGGWDFVDVANDIEYVTPCAPELLF
ncbi:hypothetical protein FRC02_009721 [Tulasnella sp. 418]|nr:hypothetical protein FRC02_009721 [Tulasnella sp. 418]